MVVGERTVWRVRRGVVVAFTTVGIVVTVIGVVADDRDLIFAGLVVAVVNLVASPFVGRVLRTHRDVNKSGG
jgi:hypothetical protein